MSYENEFTKAATDAKKMHPQYTGEALSVAIDYSTLQHFKKKSDAISTKLLIGCMILLLLPFLIVPVATLHFDGIHPVLSFLCLTIAGCALAIITENQKNYAKAQRDVRSRQEVKNQRRNVYRDFIDENYSSAAALDNLSVVRDRFIFIDDAFKEITVVAMVSDTEANVVANELVVPVDKIMAISIERATTTTYRTEQQTVIQPGKSKSVVKRAVVGTLFGPVGTVVGAISGIGTTAPTSTSKTVYIPEEKQSNLSPILALQVMDVREPFVRIAFPDVQLAETWKGRIEAAMANLRQAAPAGAT